MQVPGQLLAERRFAEYADHPIAGRASISTRIGSPDADPHRVFGSSKPASRSTYFTIAVRSSFAAPLCIACLNTSRAAWQTLLVNQPAPALRAVARAHLTALAEAEHLALGDA